MSNQKVPILSVDNFDISKVSFAKPRKDDYGQRIYLNYNDGAFMIKTPVVRFPFGLSKVPEKYNQGPEPKFTMPITISEWTDEHENTEVRKYYNVMMELEQMVMKYIADNSKELFGKKKSLDVVEEKFNTIFRRGTDKEGKDYPPKMTFKIPYYKGSFGCDVHVSKSEKLEIDADHPDEAIPSGSTGYVVFNMSLYLGASTYSMPMNAKLIKVKPRLGAKVDFSDVLEDSDEEADEEADDVEEEESEDEIEEDDSEEEPEPVKAKRGRKKLTTPN